MPAKSNVTSFIRKARKVHGDTYLYDKVVYATARIPVAIYCQLHGEFHQTPDNHLRGQNCPKCVQAATGKANRLSQDAFIARAFAVHGDTFDYGKVAYLKNTSKICIVCRLHGDFIQEPRAHLEGQGCPTCGALQCADSRNLGTQGFVRSAKLTHGSTYDYTLVDYINSQTKVKIICRIHGEFGQLPASHLSGLGCRQCGYLTERHGSGFDYVTMHGVQFLVQSQAESAALSWLIDVKHVSPNRIRDQRYTPQVDYWNSIKRRAAQYRPDFYIPDKKILVEVKSEYSMGLVTDEVYGTSSTDMLQQTQDKVKAATLAGYDVRLLVHNRNTKSVTLLPHAWVNWALPSLRDQLKEITHRI